MIGWFMFGIIGAAGVALHKMQPAPPAIAERKPQTSRPLSELELAVVREMQMEIGTPRT